MTTIETKEAEIIKRAKTKWRGGGDFARSVNTIATKGDRLFPPSYYVLAPPGFSDLPPSLELGNLHIYTTPFPLEICTLIPPQFLKLATALPFCTHMTHYFINIVNKYIILHSLPRLCKNIKKKEKIIYNMYCLPPKIIGPSTAPISVLCTINVHTSL